MAAEPTPTSTLLRDSNTPLPAVASPLEAIETKARVPIPSMPRPAEVVAAKREWNTKNLGFRLSSDAVAAASAASLVAPIITIIDRGIIENASGRNKLGASIKASISQLLLRPHRFIFSRPFGLIFSLYFGTYLTANTLDTASSTVSSKPAHTVTAGSSKFIATTGANLSLCLYKDSQFTRLFGPVSPLTRNPLPARPVPLPSYLLFATRDALTIFASFNVPSLLAPILPLSEGVEKHMSRASAAQFLAPAAVQLFSTPLHLLGLDLYNRSNAGAMERFRKVRVDWLKSSLARMGRIIPAFGVGGVVNQRVRGGLMRPLE